MTLKKSRLDYKWVVLIVCFLMEFLCLGFCSSNVGLYTKAVTEALNIKRSVYSLSTSIRYVVQVVTALYFGALVNRFGIKKMVCIGLISLTGSVVIRAYATEFYHLYIGGALWGVGIVFVGSTMAGTIVRRWFHQDIGKYTGIVMSANGIGGAIAAQIISPIINNGETFGYRKAYLLSAVIALAIGIVIMIFLREHPADGPVVQTTTAKKKPKGAMWTGIPYETVKKKPYFYAAAAMVFLTGISLQSIGSISVVYITDLGMSPSFIATSATVSSLCLTGTKILVGTVYDKKGLRFTLAMCQVAAIIAFAIKAVLTNSIIGMVLTITASVLVTIATPLETVMLPLLSNDLFGSASYNKVLGIFMAMNSLGLCLGSPLGDLYFDTFGTYRPCFWFFAVLIAVVAIGYQFVIRAAQKDKEAILAAENV
ncbi:MAG: MFS transporter [Oscillospiraceae bacterium]|nr:MFS transporter [Oscillospiraceae bacterium]